MDSSCSPFSRVQSAPADPILGLTEAYLADPNPSKVNLGVGVYQSESGKVPVLDVVREAELRVSRTENSKSYLPIEGMPEYNREVQKLLLGPESPLIAAGRVVTVQAPGGTGAFRVGADFLKQFYPHSMVVISDPSWENHRALFEAAGFKVGAYRYYDRESKSLDFTGMMEDLKGLNPGTIVVLHVCCHNPSGADLSSTQWTEVVEFFRSAGLIAFLDFAYQGFGRGLEEDAFAVRAFAEAEIPCLISSSFSKSFSLYRERVDALTFIAASHEEAKCILSQVKRVVRTNYSNPPSHGGQVVATVLSDATLRRQWEQELAEMRDRIFAMRSLFVRTLRECDAPQDFSFIERQRGMFSYSGLPLEKVRQLRAEKSLYIVDSGRICLAAMNTCNMSYICAAIAEAL